MIHPPKTPTLPRQAQQPQGSKKNPVIQMTWSTNVMGRIPTVPTSECRNRNYEDQHRRAECILLRRREFPRQNNQCDSQVRQPIKADEVENYAHREQDHKHRQSRAGILHTFTDYPAQPVGRSRLTTRWKGGSLTTTVLIAVSPAPRAMADSGAIRVSTELNERLHIHILVEKPA